MLQSLQPRDVVLIKNISLCLYQGVVCGQSRPSGYRDSTIVDILWRENSVGRNIVGGRYGPKVDAVVEWVRCNIRDSTADLKTLLRGRGIQVRALPPDSF